MDEKDTVDSAILKIGIGKYQFIQLGLLTFVHGCNLTMNLSLVFLGPFLRCAWRLSHVEESLVAISLCLGMIIGCSGLGACSDKFGRKRIMVLSNSGLLFFGLLSSLSPTFGWVLVLRCIVGICIGGTSASVYALLTELTPTKWRGAFVILMQSSRVLSTMYTTTFSFVMAHRFGWRVFLVMIAVSIIFTLLALIWVPESPRFLALHNQIDKSLQIINEIAVMNKAPPIENIYEKPSKYKSSFQNLIHSNYFLTTIFMAFLSNTGGLIHYCVIMLTTVINGIPHRCLEDLRKFATVSVEFSTKTPDFSCCFIMSWTNYKNLYIAAIAEFLTIPLSILLIIFIGRKKLMAACFFIIFVVIFQLNFCLSSLPLTIVFFILRAAINIYLIVAHIYTAEVFPTSVRSSGLGVCGSCLRSGMLLSPLVVNILTIEYSFFGGIILLSSLSFISFIICLCLPYETKDRELYQTVDLEDEKSKLSATKGKTVYNEERSKK